MTRPLEESGQLPANALVELYMRNTQFSQLRALLLLYQYQTLNAAATARNESFASLRNQIARENDWFRDNTGVELIEHVSKNIVLTANGQWVASQLIAIEGLIKTALVGLEASSIPLQVPCTSDCIDDLSRFISNMPKSESVRPFTFAHRPITTSEFSPTRCANIENPIVCLGSQYITGSTLSLPSYISVAPLRYGKIVAIMNEDPDDPIDLALDSRGRVALLDLLRAHVKILTSIGGVAWDFLYEHERAVTDGLRNGMHTVVHDLHYGLKMLASQSIPRGVMLVHGVEEQLLRNNPKYPLLEYFKCYPLRESSDTNNRAITALFYNRRAASACNKKVQAAYEALWNAAISDSAVQAVVSLSPKTEPEST